jgi:predicted RND superfamily exporter protein/lauroyl/myristoyl acyltransferase
VFARFRFLRYLVIAAVVVLGLWSLWTLGLQTELLPLFPPGLPLVQILRAAQAHFSSEREILAVVPAHQNPGWETMGKIAGQLSGQPGIEKAEVGLGEKGAPALWLAGMAATLPPAKFAALRHRLEPSAVAAELQAVLGEMSGALDESEMGELRFDPLQLNRMIFPEGSNPLAQSLALPPVLSIESSRPLRTFADDQRFVAATRGALEAATRSLGLNPRPPFLLTGEPAITADIAGHMRRDIIVMLAFTIALTSLAFWVTYRSLMPLLWILIAQLLAVLCALVVARLVFSQVNVLSIGFSSILLGVGMDYCILVYHFFAQPGEIDLQEWKELRRAILLSAFTTAATFGVLYFSSFPGLRQLAVLVGSGLLATAFFATTFLADLLSRRRPRAPRWLESASARSARFISRHRLAFRVIGAVIILGAISLWPGMKHFAFYDSSVEQLEPTTLESYRAQKILQDEATQAAPPSFNAGVLSANRQAWSPVDQTALQREFSQAGLDPSWAASTVQFADALNRWHDGSLDLTGSAEASSAWVTLRTELNQTAVADFKRLSIFMFVIIVALCAAAHRSFRLVGLNLAALGLALLLLALGLYASQTSMTILSLLCIPLMIGLVIDYSLHILLALEHAGGNLVEAARHLAVPVMLTGTASVIGFSAPMLSSQPALQNFGNVMDLGTIAAVASGLLFLPALYGKLSMPALNAGGHIPRGLYRASIFSLCARLARVLPLRVTRTFAGLGGSLYARMHPEKVDVVHRNLQLLRPDLPRKTARQVYAEFGKTMADYFYIGTRPGSQAVRIIRRISGVEHLHEARRHGKGALIVTAHLGLFELGGLLMARHGLATAALTLAEPTRALTSWRAAFRRRWGTDTIEIGTDAFAFLEIARRLQRQEFVATLIDRPHPRESIPVRLPAGESGFSTGILLLAAQEGTPVIVATMVRGADGFYQARVSAPLFIQPGRDRRATLEFYTQQLADLLLPDLCAHPEQWYQFVPLSRSSS